MSSSRGICVSASLLGPSLLCSSHSLSLQGLGCPSSASPCLEGASSAPSVGKPLPLQSERVCEPESLQFPSSMGPWKGHPKGSHP